MSQGKCIFPTAEICKSSHRCVMFDNNIFFFILSVIGPRYEVFSQDIEYYLCAYSSRPIGFSQWYTGGWLDWFSGSKIHNTRVVAARNADMKGQTFQMLLEVDYFFLRIWLDPDFCFEISWLAHRPAIPIIKMHLGQEGHDGQYQCNYGVTLGILSRNDEW